MLLYFCMKKTGDKTGTALSMIHFRFTPEVHKKIRIRAAELNMSLQKYVEWLIEKDLENLENSSKEGERYDR